MSFRRRRLVCQVRLSRALVKAKVLFHAVDHNARPPFTLLLTPTNALKAGTIIFSDGLVVLVLCMGSFAKIANSIIGRIAIFMVDLLFRPFTVEDRPCDMVRTITFVEKPSDLIPFVCRCGKRLFASMPSIPGVRLMIAIKKLTRPSEPIQLTGLVIISYEPANNFCRWATPSLH